MCRVLGHISELQPMRLRHQGRQPNESREHGVYSNNDATLRKGFNMAIDLIHHIAMTTLNSDSFLASGSMDASYSSVRA